MQFPHGFFIAGGFANLPLVGPFEFLTPVPLASLMDQTITTLVNTTSDNYSATPLMRKNLTISAAGQLAPDLLTTGSIFIWAENVVIDGFLDGTAGSAMGVDGANGGSGGGGAGGVGGIGPDLFGAGGAGGKGNDGDPGGNDSRGNGGLGFALIDKGDFIYPAGGNGGDGATSAGVGGAGVAGDSGYGGAGGGAGYNAFGCFGGGAAPGPVAVVCRSFHVNPSSGFVFNNGGGSDAGFGSGSGGGGGGGLFYLATKHYDGSLAGRLFLAGGGGANNGTDGNYIIFEISHDELTLTERLIGDSWDNR